MAEVVASCGDTQHRFLLAHNDEYLGREVDPDYLLNVWSYSSFYII